MIGRVPQLILVVGIVTAASACDNVSWGGFDLRLQGPSTDTAEAPSEAQEGGQPGAVQEAPPPTLALAPLLYAGSRQGDSAWVVPVGELRDGALQPLPQGPDGEEITERILASRLRPGQELTLFSEGARVGTLVVGEGAPAQGYCSSRPRAMGHLELIPGAAAAQDFLALEKAFGRSRPVKPFRPLRDQYDQRVASLSLATTAVPRVGAPWPPSLLDIRQDLRVFQLQAGEDPAVMATFLYQDRMSVGPAPGASYSLLVLGEPTPSSGDAEFDLAYAWFRPVGAEGKGAPRFFSHMDWDGDGEAEILLEVLGAETRWWAALDRDGGRWTLAFQDPCGVPRGGGE